MVTGRILITEFVGRDWAVVFRNLVIVCLSLGASGLASNGRLKAGSQRVCGIGDGMFNMSSEYSAADCRAAGKNVEVCCSVELRSELTVDEWAIRILGAI